MGFTSSFAFLTELRENNNREWFNKHKDDFANSQSEFKTFVGHLVEEMQAYDRISASATKIYRIYKDVRFSADKTPYKTSWSANIKREGTALRGGYYLQVEPSNTYIAGGFFGPNPQDLLHIRKHLEQDAESLRSALHSREFKAFYGEMRGECVKSAPRGFAKNADNLDLVRHKQFYFRHSFTDDEVLSEEFVKTAAKGFKLLLPFFNAMSEILTTDLNGLPLNSATEQL